MQKRERNYLLFPNSASEFCSRPSFKASPILYQPVSSWYLENGSAESHTCSRVSSPCYFQLPFLMSCVAFWLPHKTASEAESSPYECPVRCRGDHRSGTLHPAGHLALSLIIEMEKIFKDLLSSPLFLSCLLYFIN